MLSAFFTAAIRLAVYSHKQYSVAVKNYTA
jgi:hypothetical protein